MLKILMFIWEEITSYFFTTKLYDVILNAKKKKLDKKEPRILENFYYLDNSYKDGHIILEDTFYLANSYHKIKSFNKDITSLPEYALDEFSRFKWLYNLKSLQTKVASQKALSLILSFCDCACKYSHIHWKLDILADRIFALITNYSFLIKFASEEEKSLIYKFIYKQIKHIEIAYKYNFDANNLKISKALFASYLFCDKNQKIQSIASEAFNNAVDIQILRDGGDVSRNPENSLSNLEDILSIYYILKDNGYQDLKHFRELIDKITVFIRSIKVPDGLPIFQGGSSASYDKVTYLLSLSKVSTAVSSLLRDSKYLVIKQNNLQAVIDAGKSRYKEGSAGSIELWYKNKKIFGNLDANLKNNVLNIPLINYGLVVRKNNNSFARLITDEDKFFKYERKEEDAWNILKIQYGDLNIFGFIYHSTLYFSKKNIPCVLGEDLLTVKDLSSFKKNFKEIFLNIPLSSKIQYYKYSKNKNGIGFSLDDLGNKDKFIFMSQDTKLSVKNISYNEQKTNKVISGYNIFLKLDVNKSIIKNSWTLQQIV